jgi:hypothetical protein
MCRVPAEFLTTAGCAMMAPVDPAPVQALAYDSARTPRFLPRSARLAIVIAMIPSVARFAEFGLLLRVASEISRAIAAGESLSLLAAFSVYASWIGALLTVTGGIVCLITRGERRRLFSIACLLSIAAATSWLSTSLADEAIAGLNYRSYSRYAIGAYRFAGHYGLSRGIGPEICAVLLPLLAFMLVRRDSDAAVDRPTT